MNLDCKITRMFGQCFRKKRLREHIADRIIAYAIKEGRILYKYICPTCSHWHITKSKRYKGKENTK